VASSILQKFSISVKNDQTLKKLAFDGRFVRLDDIARKEFTSRPIRDISAPNFAHILETTITGWGDRDRSIDT
jgi:hypothetical protein